MIKTEQQLRCQAIEEASLYGLTDRETHIWLLQRVNHQTYKEIALALNMTPNSVKRHIKSILAKQQSHLHKDS